MIKALNGIIGISFFCFVLSSCKTAVKNNDDHIETVIEKKTINQSLDSSAILQAVNSIIFSFKENPVGLNELIDSLTGFNVIFCNGALPSMQTIKSIEEIESKLGLKIKSFSENLSQKIYWQNWPQVNCDSTLNYNNEGVFITKVEGLNNSKILIRYKNIISIKEQAENESFIEILITPGIKIILKKVKDKYRIYLLDFCFPCSA